MTKLSELPEVTPTAETKLLTSQDGGGIAPISAMSDIVVQKAVNWSPLLRASISSSASGGLLLPTSLTDSFTTSSNSRTDTWRILHFISGKIDVTWKSTTYKKPAAFVNLNPYLFVGTTAQYQSSSWTEINFKGWMATGSDGTYTLNVPDSWLILDSTVHSIIIATPISSYDVDKTASFEYSKLEPNYPMRSYYSSNSTFSKSILGSSDIGFTATDLSLELYVKVV